MRLVEKQGNFEHLYQYRVQPPLEVENETMRLQAYKLILFLLIGLLPVEEVYFDHLHLALQSP